MPNSINIPTPPGLTGTDSAKISQLHSYLFQFAEQMAMVLRSLENGSGQTVSAAAETEITNLSLLRENMKRQIAEMAAQLRLEMPEGGEASCTAALPAGGYEDIDVTFAEAYEAVPVVTVGLIAPADEMSGCVSAAAVRGTITTQGFTLRIANGGTDATAGIYAAAWTAVQEGR